MKEEGEPQKGGKQGDSEEEPDRLFVVFGWLLNAMTRISVSLNGMTVILEAGLGSCQVATEGRGRRRKTPALPSEPGSKRWHQAGLLPVASSKRVRFRWSHKKNGAGLSGGSVPAEGQTCRS